MRDRPVVARGLSKSFGSTIALEDVSLEFGTGITGLLGPNGAGKTTLLRILATVLPPDAGSVDVFGLNPEHSGERLKIRRCMGFMPQDEALYPHFRTSEFVEYVAILKEILNRQARRDEVRRVLAIAGLSDVGTRRIKALSGGMRRRVMLAQALINSPDLLLLDEPTAGLDPEQRMRFRDMLSRLGEERAALLSTHNTEDVATLCEKVIVLDKGRVVFVGRPADLARIAQGRVWTSVDRPADALVYWRTGHGRYRGIGDPPPDAALQEPTIEDGYLMLVGQAGTS